VTVTLVIVNGRYINLLTIPINLVIESHARADFGVTYTLKDAEPQPSLTTAQIRDINGTVLRNLENTQMPTVGGAEYTVWWDGKDDSGNLVDPGICS
jgi:flagellar hook assembly protein FlgD